MKMTRTRFVNQMKEWVGLKESNGSHKKIIDIYNGHKPLARGYKVKYTDQWCATTISACAIVTGMTSIVPLECSCERMINLAKTMGIWVENDAHVPKPADIILYDWDDNGVGDNHGYTDHIGVVEKVVRNDITVIEGNKNNAVGRRSVKVNGRYIRGYICPRFEEEVNTAPTPSPIPEVKGLPATSKTRFTITGTGSPNRQAVFEGKVSVSADSSLNVRTWAGTQNPTCTFSPLHKGDIVQVCDSILATDGTTWYYIKFKKKYGFVSGKYVTV